MDEIEKFLDDLDLNDLVRPAQKHPDPNNLKNRVSWD